MAHRHCWIVLLLGVPPATAHAAIVVDHPPDHTGGWSSDTSFQSSSERSADDFMINVAGRVKSSQ
jgi:hypothetical protein